MKCVHKEIDTPYAIDDFGNSVVDGVSLVLTDNLRSLGVVFDDFKLCEAY